MTTIRCKTVPTNLKKGETPIYRYAVLHNGTVYDDTVYAGVSRKSGQPEPLVKATGAMIFNEIAENLKHGYRVELPELSAFLTLPGSVESMSAESRRADSPDLMAHLAAKGAFKKCCQGPEFAIENISQGATVVISDVRCGNHLPADTIPVGVNIEAHAIGSGLYQPDPADPTTGAYLADSSGKLLVKATVTESTSTTLICVFPEIDLEPGTYRFCVASRNGLDPSQYGVTIGKRNVQVVVASAEGEGV